MSKLFSLFILRNSTNRATLVAPLKIVFKCFVAGTVLLDRRLKLNSASGVCCLSKSKLRFSLVTTDANEVLVMLLGRKSVLTVLRIIWLQDFRSADVA